jgi:membrane protein
MFSEAWRGLKETVLAFIEDEALTRGAAIAFYTVTSIAPILLIVIAIAGLAFGHDAAQNAITAQLGDLMGQETAQILQTAVASASSKPAGIMATIIGVVTLLVTASGVFGEMQTALNVIWKAKPKGTTTSRLIRARAASLGLVASLGFLLMVSLVVSTGLTAFGNYLDSLIPFGKIILTILNVIVSLALISFLFAAIYKVLQSGMGRRGGWRCRHRNIVHYRKVAHQLVHREQRSCVQLRRCWRADRSVVVGILFGADIFAWRGVYENLRPEPR